MGARPRVALHEGGTVEARAPPSRVFFDRLAMHAANGSPWLLDPTVESLLEER